MAGNPTVTGQRSLQIIFDDQPITPFSGVTITDPTPGAIDTVDIILSESGSVAGLSDGPGYAGLTYVTPLGASHVVADYTFQGTASDVTAELDALVLTTSNDPSYYPQQESVLNYDVTSSSGASSAESSITFENAQSVPGQRNLVNVTQPSQVIGLAPYNIIANHREANTSFVFSRGDGIEVIGGFKLGGAGHDTIALPSSDFQNFAAVLHNTGDVNGSAFITDPKTGDAIRLAGITTAELKAHPKDFSFYG